MWKCVHCETINKGGEVCRVCGSSKPYTSYGEAVGSPLTNTVKKCAGSNVSIAAMIFLAANIFLQLIGALIMANSAASILQNKMTNAIFGLSDLSNAVASSIVNYSVAGIIILNLPTIIICVFGMIYSFYARSKSELKIHALKAIQIVEVITLVLYGLEILIILISSILYIPIVPSGLQGGLILLLLSALGYLALGLIFKVFLIRSLMSIINSIKYSKTTGKISTFVGVMMYVYGSISGLSTLALITFSPMSALAKGCECTAYILFAVAIFKLKNEVARVSVRGHVKSESITSSPYHMPSSVPTVSSVSSKPDTWKRPDDLVSRPAASKESKFKGGMGRRRYTSAGSSSSTGTPVHSTSSTSSRSTGGFKRTGDLD